MISVEVKLISFYGSRHDRELGTMIIDNLGTGTKARGNYRARMYPKGAMKKHGNPRTMVANSKHFREAEINNHAREAEPIHNLVAKALTAMGYK